MLSDYEKKEIPKALEQAQKELLTANYLSECSNNAGIRAIYFKRADMLSTLIYYVKEYVKDHEAK
ncbi:MAG: hypothetical protein IJD35_05885 [Clostridia bacterium]|nr:hypothetical protein [Clostridia bacterium]